MAAKKSKANPYLWSNGTWHSRPEGKKYRQATTTRKITLTRAPAGSYDPGLDAQERAAKRGLDQLIEDAQRTGRYETGDLELGEEDLKRQQRELDEDYRTGVEGVFAQGVAGMPEVVEVYRMAGEIDYMLRVVVPDVASYDAFYKRLIALVGWRSVPSRFAMERLKATTVLPIP